MKKLELYDIDLKNFTDSSKIFTYKLDSEFFDVIETTDIKNGSLDVQVIVRKGIGYFTIDFHITGVLECVCDRCLDKLDVEVDTENSIKVKLGAEFDDSDDEMLIIPEYDGIVNIAWNIYEFAVLSLPYRLVHNDGECNEQMLNALNQVLTTDVREVEEDEYEDDEESQQEPEATDPRWDALKKILNNN